MNGKTYTTGQKWFDGCDQACICSDGVTGAYSCSDRYVEFRVFFCVFFNFILNLQIARSYYEAYNVPINRL